MHGWDPLTPVEETLGFLDDAVHAGKIHYVGLSNFTGWQLQLTLSTAAAMGLQLPVTLQQQYSLVCRENEYEVVPAALHNDIGLLPWSPLASGFLTGKYKQDAKPPSGARMGSDNPFYNRTLRLLAGKQQNWDTLDAIRDIAGSMGATPSQVALSWVTNRPGDGPHHRSEQPRAARGEPRRRRPRARRNRHPAPRRCQRPHPRRLPLRALRREAARPLRRLQRAGHPRAHVRVPSRKRPWRVTSRPSSLLCSVCRRKAFFGLP
jgi:hypothetical protein